jgi:hypothetical protein
MIQSCFQPDADGADQGLDFMLVAAILPADALETWIITNARSGGKIEVNS